MREQIADSELILNDDDSIYHLNLKPEDIADTIILVGDPGRVEKVSKNFDSIEIRKKKREFITHTGYLNNKRLTVLSTGIGTDNIDIVIQELDALVNIDLKERRVRDVSTSLQFFRLGTCGSFHPDVEVDSMVISNVGIGLDGLMSFYDYPDEVETTFLNSKTKSHFRKYNIDTVPYSGKADQNLVDKFSDMDKQVGLTLTLGGFYGPQGRQLRMRNKSDRFQELIESFEFNAEKIMNLEMETAAIYAMSNALGHRAISISVVIANRSKGTFSANAGQAVEYMISNYLERISLII